MAQRTPVTTWDRILAIAARKSPSGIIDDYGTMVVNLAVARIWEMYDWRQSLSTLPNFYLVPNEQDYGAPAVVIPSDFAGLRWANLVRMDNTPPYRQPLEIIKDLQPTHIRYLQHAIGYAADKQAFRIFPRVPDNIGSPTYLIEGQYKNRPALITTANLSTTPILFDDMYAEAMIETVKWIMWTLDSDPRAGQVQWNGEQAVYSGQGAVALGLINWMAEKEGLELGDPQISPMEPLVTGGPYNGGMIGLGFSW